MNFHQTTALSSVTTSSITAPSSTFVLSLLRNAYRRKLIDLNHIEFAGRALADDWIDAEGALGMMHEAGLFGFVTGLSS
jgi:hypothetical protein